MKVEMIGTGAIYTKYNSASTLIENRILVDIGSGNFKQLLKTGHDIQKIDAVVITHKHGDHLADIIFFIKYLFVKKIKKEIKIIGPKGLENQIRLLTQAYVGETLEQLQEMANFSIIEIDKEEIIQIGDAKIESILVNHGDEYPSYGYIINDILGLTGDTGMCEGVKTIWQKSNSIIADASLLQGDDCHMGISDLKKLLQENITKKIIATHMRDETRQQLIIENITNLIVPEDGFVFEI